MLRYHHHAIQSIYEKRLCVGLCWNVADMAGDVLACVWLVCSILSGVRRPNAVGVGG